MLKNIDIYIYGNNTEVIRRILIFLIGFFGASKSELIGYIPLLIISLLLLSALLFMPRIYQHSQIENPDELEDFIAWREYLEDNIDENDRSFTRGIHHHYFSFDPNLVSVDSLGLLGFKPWIAERIDKYRGAGGKFSVKGDLYKVYGIDSSRVEALWEVIKLPDNLPQMAGIDKPDYLKENTIKVKPAGKPKELITKGINQATAEEFQQIRGIGPAFSQRIVKYRDLLGSYTAHDQLHEVYGLKPELVDSVRKYFHLDTVDHAYISINDVPFDSLVKHPYINYNLARAIENFRIQHGRFEDAEALKEIKILPDSIFQKILPYLKIQ